MALTINHPTLKEQTVSGHTASCGASPIVAVTRAPFRGRIVKVFGVTAGAITTADATITVGVAGTTQTSAAFTIVATGSAAGVVTVASGLNIPVNEDDAITFLPAGASGANIPCTFGAVIQTA